MNRPAQEHRRNLSMARLVLTHTRLDRKDKYGGAAVAGLNALGDLVVHDGTSR
jgi:serine/threonine protein kinase HipA of HipAB toxin-antitoxin module